jgi:hypothetical protein
VSTKDLEGRWRLTERFIDIGDGNGSWRKSDPANTEQLEFSKTEIIRDKSARFKYFMIRKGQYYQVLPNGDSILVGYGFRGDTLELQPPCIESCGDRYVRF